MGWMFTNRRGNKSLFEFFSERFNFDNGKQSFKLLKLSAGFQVAYGAYRYIDKDTGEDRVSALVVLISHRPNDKEGFTFGYKDMTESCGPVEAECPEAILKMLSDPPPNDYAKLWRERCWENIREKKERPKLKTGDVIEFMDPIQFKNNISQRRFQIWSFKGNRVLLTDVGGDRPYYRIPKHVLYDRAVRVINSEEEKPDDPKPDSLILFG